MDHISKRPSKRWTMEETRTFLNFYGARKKEFGKPHNRKKRLALAQILKDMIAAGFDPKTEVHHLEVKMTTMIRAYKMAKEKNYSSYEPPFMEEMERVFADELGIQATEGYNTDHLQETTQNSGAHCPDDVQEQMPLPPEIFYCKAETESINSSIEATNNPECNLTSNAEQFEETSNSTTSYSRTKEKRETEIDDMDLQFLKELKKVYATQPDEKDPDRMFLLSLLPSVKHLTPADNMDFRLQVQQFLKDKLYPTSSRPNHWLQPAATHNDNEWVDDVKEFQS